MGNISKIKIQGTAHDIKDAVLEARVNEIEEVTAAALNDLEEKKYEKPSGGIPASDLASGVIPDIIPLSNRINTIDEVTSRLLTKHEDEINALAEISDWADGVSWNDDSEWNDGKIEPVQSDWNVTDNTNLAYIKNKPTIPAASPLVSGSGTKSVRSDYTTAIASGEGSVALGLADTTLQASGNGAFAIGLAGMNYIKATGNGSTASGCSYYGTSATGEGSYAEGCSWEAEILASGKGSHSEGLGSTASGDGAHSEGSCTLAQNKVEHAQGYYNKSNKANTTWGNAGNTLHSVGIGTSSNDRKNAFEIMQNGDVYVKGIGGYDGTNPNTSGVKTLADMYAGPLVISGTFDSNQGFSSNESNWQYNAMNAFVSGRSVYLSDGNHFVQILTFAGITDVEHRFYYLGPFTGEKRGDIFY